MKIVNCEMEDILFFFSFSRTLYLEYQISSFILEENSEGCPPKNRGIEKWRVGWKDHLQPKSLFWRLQITCFYLKSVFKVYTIHTNFNNKPLFSSPFF